MPKKETKRKPLFGNKRSKALNSTRRKQNLNMQNFTKSDGTVVKMPVRDAKKAKKIEAAA